jgi:hypothetical protein
VIDEGIAEIKTSYNNQQPLASVQIVPVVVMKAISSILSVKAGEIERVALPHLLAALRTAPLHHLGRLKMSWQLKQ